MKKLLAVVAIALSITGCSTNQGWTTEGGSKDIGAVNLSREYGEFENVQTEDVKGIEVAREQCQDWGFKDAKDRGMIRATCTKHKGLHHECVKFNETKQYKCTCTKSS
jgi:hypothetical protein